MDKFDLLALIDEFSRPIADEFLKAVDETQSAVELFIAENYPADSDELPPESGIDQFTQSEFKNHLSQGFQAKLAALHDKAEIPIVLLLATRQLDTSFRKIEFIQSEIKLITAESKRSTQIASTSKKRILETIGLTPNQTKSLAAYRKELERIAEGKAKAISTRVIRYLSASQRSAIRSAIAKGIEPPDVDSLVKRQHKALLLNRAKAIGNNIASSTAHTAQQAVIDLALQAKLVKPSQFKRFWVTAHDERVRHAHSQTEAMNAGGVNLDQPFKTPFGAVMFPPLEINCRCHVSVRKVQNGIVPSPR